MRTTAWIRAGSTVSLAACSVHAQSCFSWQQTSVLGPSARYSHSIFCDGASIMLFGGFRNDTGFQGDTWRWDGASWTRMNVPGPNPRSNSAIVYDSMRHRGVMFGGAIGFPTFSPVGDTWTWSANNNRWTQRFPAVAPSPRYNHAMAYDEVRDEVVLFGGFSLTSNAETWLYNGATWRMVNPNPAPTARVGHSMAFDARRGVVVLFGGVVSTTLSDQTWEWNGVSWRQVQLVSRPPARAYASMAYDTGRGLLVMMGGQVAGGAMADDYWEYDGAAWTRLASSPLGARSKVAMAYDPNERTLVAHGGVISNGSEYHDTWELTCPSACYADCDIATGGRVLDMFDFLCFMDKFAASDPYACDCDTRSGAGVCDLFDFLCFQVAFYAPCP